jgi:phosphonoacetaldehyde hydrolase
MFRQLKVVNFDMGGTFVNLGCTAPVKALDRTLRSRGIVVDKSLIWQDMGLPKLEHLRNLFLKPEVSKQFQQVNNRPFDYDRDLSDMFKLYYKNQLEVLRADPEATKLVPHIKELIQDLRLKKIKICLTSGYTRPMVNAIMNSLFLQGFIPDFDVSSSEGRSRKEMNLMCCRQFGFDNNNALVIGDTLEDARGAQEALMGFIGIESPHCGREQFREAGANVSVPDVSYITNMMQEHHKKLDIIYNV